MGKFSLSLESLAEALGEVEERFNRRWFYRLRSKRYPSSVN